MDNPEAAGAEHRDELIAPQRCKCGSQLGRTLAFPRGRGEIGRFLGGKRANGRGLFSRYVRSHGKSPARLSVRVVPIASYETVPSEASARSMPAALCIVSSYSLSGSESATIPPPT